MLPLKQVPKPVVSLPADPCRFGCRFPVQYFCLGSYTTDLSPDLLNPPLFGASVTAARSGLGDRILNFSAVVCTHGCHLSWFAKGEAWPRPGPQFLVCRYQAGIIKRVNLLLFPCTLNWRTQNQLATALAFHRSEETPAAATYEIKRFIFVDGSGAFSSRLGSSMALGKGGTSW